MAERVGFVPRATSGTRVGRSLEARRSGHTRCSECGGEGGIRTRQDSLDSVSYTIHNARVAESASVAAAPCTPLHARPSRISRVRLDRAAYLAADVHRANVIDLESFPISINPLKPRVKRVGHTADAEPDSSCGKFRGFCIWHRSKMTIVHELRSFGPASPAFADSAQSFVDPSEERSHVHLRAAVLGRRRHRGADPRRCRVVGEPSIEQGWQTLQWAGERKRIDSGVG
jgi:hypothetical protein